MSDRYEFATDDEIRAVWEAMGPEPDIADLLGPGEFADVADLLGPIYDELTAASWDVEPDPAPFQDAAGAMAPGSYTFVGWI